MAASLRVAARIVVPVALLALALRLVGHLEPRALWAAVMRASPSFLIAAALINVPLVATKALRSQLLLAPTQRFGVARLMSWFFASYAADNLIMSQAGLAFRIGLLHRAGVPLAIAISEQTLEKLLEGVALLGLAPLAPVATALPAWLAHPQRALWIAGACVAGITLLVLAGSRRWTGLSRLGQAALALRRPEAVASVSLLTFAGWALELAMVALALHSMGLPVTLSGALLLVLASNVAALIPGLPANLGSFEAAIVVALASQGIAAGPALAFALLYHALHTIPVTLLGLPVLRRAWADVR